MKKFEVALKQKPMIEKHELIDDFCPDEFGMKPGMEKETWHYRSNGRRITHQECRETSCRECWDEEEEHFCQNCTNFDPQLTEDGIEDGCKKNHTIMEPAEETACQDYKRKIEVIK